MTSAALLAFCTRDPDAILVCCVSERADRGHWHVTLNVNDSAKIGTAALGSAWQVGCKSLVLHAKRLEHNLYKL